MAFLMISLGVMRVIITARTSLLPIFEKTLNRLVVVLGIISKNPSNPNFDQYIFESISALMRFAVAAKPETLPAFEQALFGPFTIILQQDIDRTLSSAVCCLCLTDVRGPRIHPLCFPAPRSDARTPDLRHPGRLPRASSLPAHTCKLAAKG